METNQTISVLIEREEDWWIAQCIEQDLVTHANHLSEIGYEIQRMLIAHITSCEERGLEPFKLPPAPPEVRERFDRAVIHRITESFVDPKLRHRLPKQETRIATVA